MKLKFTRRYRSRNSPSKTDGIFFKKYNQQEQSFFGGIQTTSFFNPKLINLAAQSIQRKCKGSEEEEKKVKRQPEKKSDEHMMKEKEIYKAGESQIRTSNIRAYANCQGISVEGHTDANYSNSYSYSGRQAASSNCTDCTPPDCIRNRGIIISVFRAHPVITLPHVPGNLSVCETNAVRNFINTTLLHHEQRHVAAFNTYNGIVRTPYTYVGCADGLESYIENKHNQIETIRKASADAQSAALDPFNAPIPCNCPK